ncbi:SPFH domain-containing protein [Phnomibacter ginsenosidimutans]|uniref:SPFH domain-containing protein n=1 Tax=Phnomibacter ginsenosidimutans TaxID=2676868 RepID=A0A6I6GCA1_9BACT|nr:SPFH domain-containing protein [Phnomibacter ginsenosidimutans]QGW29363.1 SPFH domain-containing protein [Phnomibacter ginsenosidimutans]
MEKIITPRSGWFTLFVSLLLLAAAIVCFVLGADENPALIGAGVVVVLAFTVAVSGFIAIEPNSSRVLTLFGKYVGTVSSNGFFWVNPFFTKKKISLRANNLDTKPIKVNDKHGNPIMIGAVVVWKVENAYKAAFEVDNYQSFVETQSEAAIRKLAGAYAYDNFEHDTEEITLRSSSTEVNDMLEHEVTERLAIAGIQVIEARLSHLAYSTEIAGAMLQRQQATAIVAARAKIVEGAVGMVEMALEQLSKKEIVQLDEERKAAMVSNLMVVLCSERSAQPVVNAGSLY